jgi:hypothetical protein
MVAVQEGHLPIVEFLIDNEANINIKNKVTDF